jgi:predicted deacylase
MTGQRPSAFSRQGRYSSLTDPNMTAEKPVTLAGTAENPAALSSLLLRALIIAGMNRKELK